jgi:transposase
MMSKDPETLGLSPEQLHQLKQRIRDRKLEEADWRLIEGILETVEVLRNAVQKKTVAVKRLLRMLFGPRTEKSQAVLPSATTASPTSPQGQERQGTRKGKGHGRNGADEFPGAAKVRVAHANLKSGDRCPKCPKGTLYCLKDPALLIHFLSGPPVSATLYECQRLRCSSCGQVFTAEAPQEVSAKKYDESAASMIAVLKYGHGFPFHRMEHLQEQLGVPLAASTQWELVEEKADSILPVYDLLVELAAQGDILHNDDTTMKILQYLGKRAERYKEQEASGQQRTGVFTTGIVSIVEVHKIALFFTGKHHAGENLLQVLQKRQAGRSPPLQMCDALARNLPKDFKVILCNCLSHARRKFIELLDAFPQECQTVLETFKSLYFNDEQTKKQNMDPQQRLSYHQVHSQPVMKGLEAWLHQQMDEKKVEPNSSLGEAIRYMLDHWEPLTRFLKVAGAPLDNNICEIALKRAILHRKNAMFYKTQHGALVGDIYMSLIYTCTLSGANPVDYLTELERHAAELAKDPGRWLPWTYKESLAPLEGPATSADRP